MSQYDERPDVEMYDTLAQPLYSGDIASEEAIADTHLQLQLLQQEHKTLIDADIPADELKAHEENYNSERRRLINRLPPQERTKYGRLISSRGSTRFLLDERGRSDSGTPDYGFIPYFCITMLLGDIVMFFVTMFHAHWKFASMSVNPMIGPEPSILLEMGAKYGPDIVKDHEWWRLITPMFLHAGFVHLALNMIVLYRLGFSMENVFGWHRIAPIYIASSIFGTALSALFLPEELTVGASSALFGLIGAMFADFIQNHEAIQEGKWSYFAQLVASTLVGLVIGLVPLVDNFAHFGGWICGLGLGLVCLSGAIKDDMGVVVQSWYSKKLSVIAGIVVLAMNIIVFAVLFSGQDGNSWCSWCEDINCVETGWWSCDHDHRST